MTYHSLILDARERLFQAGQGEQAAQLLMVELCRQRDKNLYILMNEECDKEIEEIYKKAVIEMEQGKPLGYVLGYEWFFGYDFIVNEDVLIPRCETEELVELVLQKFDEKFSNRDHVTVFDVATGSGAIGITLNLEEEKMDVIASDISKKALDVAYKNNEKLKAHVNFICGSMLDPFIDRNLHCDILVCNPPYIPDEEEMEHSVVDYEPHVALFGGEDGLKFYRDVFEKAHLVCLEHAFMAFEMGYQQGKVLMELSRQYFPDACIQVHKDMSGKDRMLTIEL
ncbi:MAG: peptide chain release factor N(5)-glutamine methyltransferase [Floccifex porci]|uniref:peptide chain release factor N(5)-glutamine methyltransferase n=1 Tax=Floccifex porci TaxID=2606629 RepID=UPI002A8093C5|nr:peptide chain release factor N(5)-glutamine methyltransferase [Floccifex porci]MDY4796543.1 peptide chain release factor N(5)-glutamine methyltransferase [Floccifex porci]